MRPETPALDAMVLMEEKNIRHVWGGYHGLGLRIGALSLLSVLLPSCGSGHTRLPALIGLVHSVPLLCCSAVAVVNTAGAIIGNFSISELR